MFDHSVYNAQNECSETGYETLAHSLTMPEGPCIKVFIDNFKQVRIVAFKSDAHKVGYSGLLLNADGTERWKLTDVSMQGRNTTRQLAALLVHLGYTWKRSEHNTTAGLACFKGEHHA